MESGFLADLGFMGFTARIKRLSERLMLDAKSIYDESTLDIEPNWHLIFLLLKDKKELSVTEIADILGFSHPAIIKITKKMMHKGYLDSMDHPTDNRKKWLRLSEKSILQLPEFEREWHDIERVIREVVDVEFLQKLGQVEYQLNKKRIPKRYKESKP